MKLKNWSIFIDDLSFFKFRKEFQQASILPWKLVYFYGRPAHFWNKKLTYFHWWPTPFSISKTRIYIGSFQNFSKITFKTKYSLRVLLKRVSCHMTLVIHTLWMGCLCHFPTLFTLQISPSFLLIGGLCTKTISKLRLNHM